MKHINLNQLDLVELKHNEMTEVEGGGNSFAWYAGIGIHLLGHGLFDTYGGFVVAVSTVKATGSCLSH